MGVFDSGVGGLTVLREIRRVLPGESTLYLGDTARVPYGTKSQATIIRYSRQNTRILSERGIKLLVVACNTASALAMEALRHDFDFPMTGVIEPGAEAAAKTSRTKKIGVIGTSATVRSAAYTAALQARNAQLQVISKACPLFVSLAEEGWTEGEVAEPAARKYLESFQGSGIDVLLLGCTHYPLLRSVISKVMGEGISIIDSAKATAEQVSKLLAARKLAAPAGSPPKHRYLVTDSRERFLDLAPRFLGGSLEGDVEEVGVPGDD
ncbi:MAG: glutamate racemase [Bdellovibrionota bacterium]